MGDAPSMICIARMYLSGEFRPVESFNLANLLMQGGSIFPWSLRSEKEPDYQSGLEWLMKAAELGNAVACEVDGSMLCSGTGCDADIEKGICYLDCRSRDICQSREKKDIRKSSPFKAYQNCRADKYQKVN